MKYLILFVLLIYTLFSINTEAATSHDTKQPPAPVIVSKVIEMQIQPPVTFVGTVEPGQRSLVATEISGLVKNLIYKEGDFVKKGDIVAQLKYNSLRIQSGEAEAALKESLARLEYATSRLIRFKDLYERSVISIEELQETESDKNAWAERSVQYNSKIERLAYDIEQTQIKAPFDGYIISKHTEIGEWLVEGAKVYELINLDSIYVLVYVPEQLAVKLSTDGSATITFDAFPDLVVNGHILTVIPQASLKARTFPVKVGFLNYEGKIKSGLLARVSFLTGNNTTSKLVPKDAIVEMQNKKFVYTIKDGMATPIPVETGMAHDDMIEIFAPVTVGMPIIIRGNERIRPGQPVEVRPASIIANED